MFPEMLLSITFLSAWTQKCMNSMCEWSHHVPNDNAIKPLKAWGAIVTATPSCSVPSVSEKSSGSQGPFFLFSLTQEFCVLVVSNGL